MTQDQAYTRLLAADAEVNRLEADPAFRPGPAYREAILAWCRAVDILDPAGRIEYCGDITVFAPKACAVGQRELFA